jgi:hypothetical protein
MRIGIVGENAHRALDQLDGMLRPPAGRRDHAEHVQGVRMVRRFVQDSTVDGSSSVNASRTMMRERRLNLRFEPGPACLSARAHPCGPSTSNSGPRCRS